MTSSRVMIFRSKSRSEYKHLCVWNRTEFFDLGMSTERIDVDQMLDCSVLSCNHKHQVSVLLTLVGEK